MDPLEGLVGTARNRRRAVQMRVKRSSQLASYIKPWQDLQSDLIGAFARGASFRAPAGVEHAATDRLADWLEMGSELALDREVQQFVRRLEEAHPRVSTAWWLPRMKAVEAYLRDDRAGMALHSAAALPMAEERYRAELAAGDPGAAVAVLACRVMVLRHQCGLHRPRAELDPVLARVKSDCARLRAPEAELVALDREIAKAEKAVRERAR